MAQKRSKPAPLATGTGLGMQCLAACTSENSASLSQIQAAYLASRYGIGAARARVTAELAWGRA